MSRASRPDRLHGPLAAGFVAAWTAASIVGAVSAAAVTLGTLGYYLAIGPGQLVLWGLVGTAHWVVLRQYAIDRGPLLFGVMIAAAVPVGLIPLVAELPVDLSTEMSLVVLTAIAGAGVGWAEGSVLSTGRAPKGLAVMMHVGVSAAGAALGSGLALATAGAIGVDTRSTIQLVATISVAAAIGAAVYGVLTGASARVLLNRWPAISES